MKNVKYYLLYFIFRLVAFVPLRLLYLVSDFLYLIFFRLLKYRKSVVEENLKNSFPEKDEKWLTNISEKFYSHLCDVVVETIYFSGVSKQEILRRVSFNNPEVIENYLKEGKDIAAVMSHYGNWEWISAFPAITGYKCITIYRPLKSKLFDRLMTNIRRRFGADLVPMKMSIRALLNYKSANTPSLTGYIADQAPPKEKAYWIRFLNQETAVYTGLEQVARKMGMAVVFFKMNKIKRGYYEIDFIPICDDASLTSEFEITKKHIAMLDAHIKSRPELWLWSHRRWKIKR